ncbi:MAG: heme/copper-type cytochrome/quinol oxidase, subunit 3 [Sphingomonas bacterium]|nr:heme/copper-type cytochrome/quinol oxidase, subunit 3 [Sphingomonas bacterium]
MARADATPAVEQAPEQAKAPGIWIFIAFDCTSFGLFFLVFMVERLAQPATFDSSAHLLDARLGLINTCILITSSWIVALANRAGRAGDMRRTRNLLYGAIVIGSGFGVIKIAEYVEKLRAGITVATDEFFIFYFALTGVHLLHYLIGLAVLAVLAAGAARPISNEDQRTRYVGWLDGGALYWHMVDLLWVFLFSMLYLLGAR